MNQVKAYPVTIKPHFHPIAGTKIPYTPIIKPKNAVDNEASNRGFDGNGFLKNQSLVLVLKIVACPAIINLVNIAA